MSTLGIRMTWFRGSRSARVRRARDSACLPSVEIFDGVWQSECRTEFKQNEHDL